jgi:hypothetical protein
MTWVDQDPDTASRDLGDGSGDIDDDLLSGIDQWMPKNGWLGHLTRADVDTIGACLRAAADGPFFPDWEFQTLFGLEREEVRTIASTWPSADSPKDQWLAVEEALDKLLEYPREQDAMWDQWIPVSESDLGRLQWHVKELSGANDWRRAQVAAELAYLAAAAPEARRSWDVANWVEEAQLLGVPVPLPLRGLDLTPDEGLSE